MTQCNAPWLLLYRCDVGIRGESESFSSRPGRNLNLKCRKPNRPSRAFRLSGRLPEAFSYRIVIFTSVNEERFRSIANLLTTEGYAPSWFADIEYITWSGKTKNLIFVDGASPEEILLVDDYEKYVHPGQENQWIKVPDFDYPYSDDDLGLGEVLRLLRIRVAS